MSIQTKLILFTIFCAFLQLSCGQEKCEACGEISQAYCVNKSSYYLCMNKKPIKSKLYTCDDGQVCTSSYKICEPEADGEPLCKDSSCDKCPPQGSKYICISKTQYGRCIDGNVVIVDSCDSGSFCNTDILAKGGHICAPSCVLEFFGLSSTCSNDEQITTTVPPPPTPNVNELVEKCKADPKFNDEDTKIYYVLNGDECKTYIYCEKFGNEVEALLMRCLNGFYDINQNKCVPISPGNCGDEQNNPDE